MNLPMPTRWRFGSLTLTSRLILQLLAVGLTPLLLALLLALRAYQQRIVNIVVGDIQPKPVNAPVEPEAGDIKYLPAHRQAVKVEVRLTGKKIVQIVLAPLRLPGPRRTSEPGLPVVRGRSVRPWVRPDIPVRPRIISTAPALLEPGMID